MAVLVMRGHLGLGSVGHLWWSFRDMFEAYSCHWHSQEAKVRVLSAIVSDGPESLVSSPFEPMSSGVLRGRRPWLRAVVRGLGDDGAEAVAEELISGTSVEFAAVVQAEPSRRRRMTWRTAWAWVFSTSSA